jgi:hypothetical protein
MVLKPINYSTSQVIDFFLANLCIKFTANFSEFACIPGLITV